MNLKTFLNILISLIVVVIIFNLVVPFSAKSGEPFLDHHQPRHPMMSPEIVENA